MTKQDAGLKAHDIVGEAEPKPKPSPSTAAKTTGSGGTGPLPPKPEPPPVPAEAKSTREELLAKAKLELQHRAQFAMHSHANAAGVIQEYAKQPFGEQDLDSLIKGVRLYTEDVHNGDMQRCESMLMGQALALQSIFTHMSRRVLNQEYQRHTESFFAMALKAQNQCRMTLETLNEIKYPRQVAFVRQANIANGPQQVNNRRVSRTRKKSTKRTNKLLEQTDGNRLDSPAPPATKLDDPAMAALEAINGTQDGGGQGNRGTQRLQGRDARKAAGTPSGAKASRVRAR
jgi:hypothetical protein